MNATSGPPALVLNFAHPLNEVCQRQLEDDPVVGPTGFVEWRHPGGYVVEKDDLQDAAVEGWLRSFEATVPDWRGRLPLYWIGHSFPAIHVKVEQALKRLVPDPGRDLRLVVRGGMDSPPFQVFPLKTLGGRKAADARLDGVRAYLLDPGLEPMDDRLVGEVRTLCAPFDVRYHWLPYTATCPRDYLCSLARALDLSWESTPFLLGWARWPVDAHQLIELLSSVHGVSGHFPPIVRLGFRPEVEERLRGLPRDVAYDEARMQRERQESLKVDKVVDPSVMRQEGSRLRAEVERMLQAKAPSGPAEDAGVPAGAPLPAAVALVAFHWPRWARNHADADLVDGPARGRRHLDRLEARVQPGNVPASRAGLEADLVGAVPLFRQLVDRSRPHVEPALAAVRAWLSTVGERYRTRTVVLARLPGMLAGADDGIAVAADGGWPDIRVAVDPDDLLARVVLPLVRNAREHGGAGRVVVTSRHDPELGRWTLRVANDGAPFDLGLLDRPRGAGTRDLLAFAALHLATISVVARTPEGARRRTRDGGTYHWDGHDSLVQDAPPDDAWKPPLRVGAADLPAPWNVAWELRISLDVLGDPSPAPRSGAG